MGWKTFKEKFNIEHQVCITERWLCIGSPYIHNLAIIDTETGEIVKGSPAFTDFLSKYYPKIIESTKEERLAAIRVIDSFKSNIPVYTFSGGAIIQRLAESVGYPNVTHDGHLMHDNTYFKTKTEAIDAAISDNSSWLEYNLRSIGEKKAELAMIKAQHKKRMIVAVDLLKEKKDSTRRGEND